MKMPLPLIALCLLAGWSRSPAEEAVLAAVDTPAMTRAIGTDVTVEGQVLKSFWVRNVLMIVFREEKDGFIAVSFAQHREALDEAFGGNIASEVEGKKVRITGKVEEYQGRPQIVIREAGQLKILP